MSCFVTLKEKGLRLTQPRRVILEYIHDNSAHLTAEEIISHVHAQFPHINKSTIYRTLDLLEKNNCVFKSKSMDRTIYHHADEGHHHHLVCSKCGKTIDCDEDIFSTVEKELKKKLGFQVNFKHVVMSGLCKECRNEKN
jgi:Fur family ferric uptake transcriptional regulator